MTEAAFVSFVKGHLRRASRFWKPITDTLKAANLRRGVYLCNECKEEVSKSVVINGKRVNNISVDHKNAIVDPTTGFSGWDDFVNNLYCETENLQVLCKACHDKKSSEERNLAKESRDKKKEQNENSIQSLP